MRRADRAARLAQAQLAVARDHGFASWRALRADLDRLAAAAPDPVVEVFAAIRRGEGPVVDRLLASHPALASARDEEGGTPLSACRAGHEGTARELLAHGPDLAFRAFAGGTALHWAYFAGAPPVVALLLAAGADPALRDPVLGCTPEAFGICVPASWGWASKVRERLEQDPALVATASRRGGPLHEAAHADPGRRNADGRTALDLARARPEQAGCAAVVEWLVGSALEPRR